MLTPREKSPQPENSPQRRMEPTTLHQAATPTHNHGAIPAPPCIKQDSQPNTQPWSYSSPTLHQAGQPAQHTTMELFQPHPAPSRTASPTHYHGAIPAPIKQDSQPNTLPWSYSGPTLHQAGQPAQHTTIKLFRPHAASSRTASPTHNHGAIPAPPCIKQGSQPNTLPLSYSGPMLHRAGQPAQHTTNWAIPAPRCMKQDSQPNTQPWSYSSPTLHQTGQPAQHTTNWAISAPRCIKQDSQPNTLPTSYSGPMDD